MRATEILMAEHRIIESALHALEDAARRLHKGADVPSNFFLDAAEFIRGYADGVHHYKEEGVLFKAMVARGFSEEHGPVGVMLSEHAQARHYTQELHAAALRLNAGDTNARSSVVDNALAYVQLLRQHIQKEDRILYVMAEQVIPPDEQDQMEADFAAVESEKYGTDTREKYEALARDLARRLPPA